MPMGLSVSLVVWQSYKNAILGNIPDRPKYLAIMINIVVQSKHSHLKYLDNLLTVLLKNSLKISCKQSRYLELSTIYG